MFPLTDQEKEETQRDLVALLESLNSSAELLSEFIEALRNRAIVLDKETEQALRKPINRIGSLGFQLNLTQYKARNFKERQFTMEVQGIEPCSGEL